MGPRPHAVSSFSEQLNPPKVQSKGDKATSLSIKSFNRSKQLAAFDRVTTTVVSLRKRG